MKPSAAQLLAAFVIVASWLAGVAIAHGFWSTLSACGFPPWAWYLVVERLVVRFL